MTEKQAQENPNSPAGWAVQEVVNPDAHANGELLAIEQQKRQDTATWEDQQNRSPMDNENPAQPGGWAVPPATNGPIPGQGADAMRSAAVEPEVVARVYANRSAHKLAGSKVLLGTSQEDHVLGEVVARSGDKFWVAWREPNERGETDTVESMRDYELMIREDEG